MTNMAEREAFTAGVRPGGLTTSTEIRLLLCYLVQNTGAVSQHQLEAALMDTQLVNYFEIGSGLDDIRRQGLVAQDARRPLHHHRQRPPCGRGAGLRPAPQRP